MKAKLKKNLHTILTIAVAASLLFALIAASVRTAYAVPSLPHIVEITSALKTGASFNILEIVPQEGAGSVGYYIAGQEPTAGWQEKLSRLTTAQERLNNMNGTGGVLTGLKNAGLMSASPDSVANAAYPLHNAGEYQEAYPWSRTSAMSKTLKLLDADGKSRTEEADVSGSFEAKADGASSAGYDYSQQTSYALSDSGSYLQRISRFEPADAEPEIGAQYFYYNPTFLPLSLDAAQTLPDAENVAVYVKDKKEDGTPYYRYDCQLSDDLADDGKTEYFYLANPQDCGNPSQTPDGNTYRARLVAGNSTDSFLSAPAGTTGYFNLEPTGYTYVGAGLGSFKFTAGGSGSVKITTDTVFYAGGYTNNNWFAVHVLDMTAADAAKANISVTDMTPQKIQAAGAAFNPEAYQLIVLSNGFAANGAALTPYSAGNDLTPAAISSIKTAFDKLVPVLADSALLSLTATGIGRLAGSLKGGSTASAFVRQNFYLYAPPLATRGFTDSFQATAYQSADAPFNAVYAEIKQENLLREKEGRSTELLPETVSMATAVRYVINYAGQRVLQPKEKISVLDVEPGKSIAGKLSKDTVKSWLPSGKYEDGDITIQTMSTAEFIGKIEDVAEIYDVVYIGDCVDAFQTDSSGHTLYNDAAMNGLVYTNIGDTYRSGYNLSGLLDRDYYSKGGNENGNIDGTNTSAANLYRFSGNDLTAAKVQKLEDFAATGYPIILADDLIADNGVPERDYTLTARITPGTQTEESISLSADYTLLDASHSAPTDSVFASYQWYKNGQKVANTTVALNADVGVYYCEVTVTCGGVTKTAKSNSLQVSERKIFTQTVAASSGTYPRQYTITYSSTKINNNKATARVDLSPADPDLSYTCNWYDAWDIYFANGKSISLNKSSPSSYYCVVDIYKDGQYWNSVKTGTMYKNTTSSRTRPLSIDRSFTVDVTDSNDALTYNGTSPANIGATAKWVCSNRTDSSAADGSTLSAADLTVGDIWSCRATVGKSSATSATYRVVKRLTAAQKDASVPVPFVIPAVPGTVSANPRRVDVNSQMYRLLNDILAKKNVMASAAAKKDQSTVYTYLNLSKPKIVFESGGYPTPYAKDDGGTVTGILTAKELRYSFRIVNATDATPETSRYSVSLYLDQNGDGNYTDSELLSDILCKDSAGAAVELDALKAGTYDGSAAGSGIPAPVYTVTRQLPETAVGILPWKLLITKVGTGNEYIHTSAHNYAYVKPTADQIQTINILQINKGDNKMNLQEQTKIVNSSSFFSTVTQKYYGGVYGKLLADVSGDFQVNICTITVDDFNGYDSIGNIRNEKIKEYLQGLGQDGNLPETGDSVAFRSALLQKFNMIIAGFGDTYGNLNQESAQAIVSYISSGKSILFAHDTTSFVNTTVTKLTSDGVNQYSGSDLANTTMGAYSTIKLWSGYLSAGSYRLTANFWDTHSGIQLSVKENGDSTKFNNGYGCSLNYYKTEVYANTSDYSSSIDMTFSVTTPGNVQILLYNGTGYQRYVNLQSLQLTPTSGYSTSHVWTDGTPDRDTWGYQFNTLLRSSVGLDRYGISSSRTAGASTVRGLLKTAVAGSTLSVDQAGAISENGYTVAYQPGAAGKTVPETQGYTAYELLRYPNRAASRVNQYGVYGIKNADGRSTSTVCQTNEGQITTYPYDINTKYFKTGDETADNTLKVTGTHEQYYQLNMNADDIVVWYCLSGGCYDFSPNDVVNNYYIYSVGNVTYTGAGHTSDENVNKSEYLNEAKLFVNTMIAAYRTKRTTPTIQAVKSPTDPSPISNYYVTANYDGENGYMKDLVESDADCPVYFIVKDTNLDSDRTVSVALQYGNGKIVRNLAVRRVSGSGSVTVKTITSGIVYDFLLPDEVKREFGSQTSESTMKMQLLVSTTFREKDGSDTTLDGTAYPLTLQKTGLLNLS